MVLLVAALMVVVTFSAATIQQADATTRGLKSSTSQNVSRLSPICVGIFLKCDAACFGYSDGKHDEVLANCIDACIRIADLCEQIASTWPGSPHAAGGNNGEGNLKDFPADGGGKLKAHANPGGGGMSTMQGGATATILAAPKSVSTSAKPPSASSMSKPAVGGSGLFSGPGTPRLRAQ